MDWGVVAATTTRATDERFRKLVGSNDTLGRIANLLTQRRKVVRGQRVDRFWEQVDARFLADEIAMVIQGRGLATLQEYLAADRTGRREALTGHERELLWRLYEDYQAKLHSQRILDFASLPQVVLAALRDDPAFIPFEAVVVDEAQDSSPFQLRLATALAGGSARLTVLGDAARDGLPHGL